MTTKRIFVSIDLPEQTKARLKTLQRPEIRPVKWMKPENFHITLNFLGDLPEGEINDAVRILREVAEQTKQFDLTLHKFISERDMLWLLPESNPALFDLQSALKVEFRSSRIGKRERRDYFPHILFAKTKTGRRFEWQLEKFAPLTYRVEQICLYESRLTPGAATHILLQNFALQ